MDEPWGSGQSPHRRGHKSKSSKEARQDFINKVSHLVSALDIEVEFEDRTHNIGFLHKSDWMGLPPKKFLQELYDKHFVDNEMIDAHASMLIPLDDNEGRLYGRAALVLSTSSRQSECSRVSVGGFAYSNRISPMNYLGVISGEPTSVSRQYASIAVPSEVIAQWATKQAKLIDARRVHILDQLRACQVLKDQGGNTGDLPYCYCGGSFVSYAKFEEVLRSHSKILIPLTSDYEDRLRVVPIGELQIEFFVHVTVSNVVVLHLKDERAAVSDEEDELDSDSPIDVTQRINELSDTAFERLTEIAKKIWNRDPVFRIETDRLFEQDLHFRNNSRWVISVGQY